MEKSCDYLNKQEMEKEKGFYFSFCFSHIGCNLQLWKYEMYDMKWDFASIRI